MRMWIKITKGDKEKGIKALEKLAINEPKVCINSELLEYAIPNYEQITVRWTMDYFSQLEAITQQRCNSIISKSGEPTGDYDFYFEWLEKPDPESQKKLENDVKKALEPLKVQYTLVNK